MCTDKILIRKIRYDDNKLLAKIIRDTLIEFKANKQGTVFYNKTTDHLFEAFETKEAIYFVALSNGTIAGGAGIYPTHGLTQDTCELVKMYLLPFARRKCIGKMLTENCTAEAKKLGYKKIYLETMPELTSAIKMYERFSFEYLDNPLGNSGHNGCNLWMVKEI